MKIFIEEEYGYAFWIWEYPGTEEELERDFVAGHTPKGVGFISKGIFKGKVWQTTTPHFNWSDCSDEEMDRREEEYHSDWIKFLADFDANCHIHGEDDSWLLMRRRGARVIHFKENESGT